MASLQAGPNQRPMSARSSAVPHGAAAGRLPIGEQVELLSAIFDLTFPQGIDPFVARLEALGVVRAPAVASGKGPVTPSPAPSKN